MTYAGAIQPEPISRVAYASRTTSKDLPGLIERIKMSEENKGPQPGIPIVSNDPLCPHCGESPMPLKRKDALLQSNNADMPTIVVAIMACGKCRKINGMITVGLTQQRASGIVKP
jgi:hypothetical protein